MKTLNWKNYAPMMPELRNWDEVKRHQVNKEAEVIVPDRELPKVDNRRFLKQIEASRPNKFSPGIYNFVRRNIISSLLP